MILINKGGFVMIFFIFLGIAIMLYVIGGFIRWKKVTWLISGYNTASKEEKQKYDIDKLCYHMSNFIFVLASIWLAMTLLMLIMPQHLELIIYVGIGAETIAMILGIIYLNTGNRVMKE